MRLLPVICFLFIYSTFYGGFSFYLFGLNGVLMASIFITTGCILGILFREEKK
jgi:hypothetical protein